MALIPSILPDEPSGIMAGGPGGGTEPTPPDEIVVIARYIYEPSWYFWGFGFFLGEYRGGFYEPPGYDFLYDSGFIDAPDSDSDLVEVKTNITRKLTDGEKRAIDALDTAIADATAILKALPSDAIITMPDGQIITAAELKKMWALTDFVINEKGTTYRNQTDRGEADYGNGNPQISFNIDQLEESNAYPGGIISTVFHELGHMTAAGRSLSSELYSGGYTSDEKLQIERFANDLAHAFADYADFEVMPWQNSLGSGAFSSETPTITQSDSTSSLRDPDIPEWKVVNTDSTGYDYYWIY